VWEVVVRGGDKLMSGVSGGGGEGCGAMGLWGGGGGG
jgi:hypothetical protein